MAVRYFDHPVSLSRKILDDHQLGHCALSGEGALKYAREIGFPILDDPRNLIVPEAEERIRTVTLRDGVPPCCDSVTAVALDCKGNLACATSTGNGNFMHNHYPHCSGIGTSKLTNCLFCSFFETDFTYEHYSKKQSLD